MKNLIYLFGILAITFAFSCKPVKSTTNTTLVTVHDTIRDIRIVEKFKAVHDTLLIDNPCDSAGILTTFYSKITIPQGKVIIRSYRGKIQATVNIDSIQSVYESKYKSLVNKSVQTKEKLVVKNVIPSWIITVILIESLIILLYLYFKYIFP
jgi:hypothetical protein